MQKISIETTQNVAIEYPVASIGDRIIAALIDLLIIAGYTIAVISFNAIINYPGLYQSIAYWVILFLPVFFYDLLCELFLGGQSFGKKLRKIKVVKMDGSQPTFVNYFLRWIIRPVDIYLTYGAVAVVTILINGKGQRLGDIAANTTLIKIKNEATLYDTIFTEIEDKYEPKFPQVTVLNDKDIALIKEVLEQLPKMPDIKIYNKLLVKTREEVSKKTGAAGEDMNAMIYLNTILKDYNYYNNL